MTTFTASRRPGLRAPRRRALAANDEFFAPKENLLKAGPRRVFARASTPTAASGWTAGRRAGAASRATTGASSGSALPGVVAASSSTRRTSRATSPRPARSRRATRPRQLERATRSDGGRALDRDPAAVGPLGGDSENLFPVEHAGRVTHLRLNIYPGRRRRAPRVHGEVGAGLGSRCARTGADRRPRRGRERRARRLRQRHVLRLAPQPDPAGPRARHGRRLGDAPPPRPGPRLGRSCAGTARNRCAASRSTRSTSRATRPAPARSRSRMLPAPSRRR